MTNFPQIKTIIDAAIALDLGNPNFTISSKEALLKDAAIQLGTLDYYRSFPFRTVLMTSYNSGYNSGIGMTWTGTVSPKIENNMMYVPFEDVFSNSNPSIPQDQWDNAYFLGVLRVERPMFNTYSNPGMWSLQLLGVQTATSATNVNILNTIYNNTLDGLSTGEPMAWIDRSRNRIQILQSYGFGILAITLAIGFTSPEYVEMSKVDYLCKFISYRFIESVIQARSGVKLTADFEISTQALEERLKTLKEECQKIKDYSVLQHNQWSG